MDKVIINKNNSEEKFQDNIFLDYLNFWEAIKTSCKAFHWGIANTNIKSKGRAHVYLDDLEKKISNYSDMIAETSQGILGSFITPNNIKAKEIPPITSLEMLCDTIIENIKIFYTNIENDFVYVGIKADTETLVKDIQIFKYFFRDLCS